MSKISEYLAQIKTAIYGREVRDAIHDSIEQCYTDVSNAKTLADTAASNTNAAISKANTAASNADTKAKLANDAATKATDAAKKAEDAAEKADKAHQNILIGSETGNPVSVSDAFSAPLCGLTVYGRSTQDGTPSPDNPVPIVSAGDGGTIGIKTTGKNLISTEALFSPTKNCVCCY